MGGPAGLFTRGGCGNLRSCRVLPAAAIASEKLSGKPEQEVRVLEQQALLSQQMADQGTPVQIEDLFPDVFSRTC